MNRSNSFLSGINISSNNNNSNLVRLGSFGDISSFGTGGGSKRNSIGSLNNDQQNEISMIYSLPNEVVEVIMKCFTSKEICIYLSCLSHYFYSLSRSNSLWHFYCIKDFKINKDINKLIINTVDWFSEYVLMHKSLVDICCRPLYLSDEQSLNYVYTKKVTINNFNIQYDDKLEHRQKLKLSQHHPNSANSSQITILNIRKTKPDSTLLIQSKKKVTPLPYGNFNFGYFEITLLAVGEETNVFIGYSASCETNEKKVVLKSAAGYHGADGGMYSNPVMGKEISEPWQCNDTAGCGVDFMNKKIFFTKNGVLLGKTTSSLSLSKLHATIGTISYGDKFGINFGCRPFEFDIIQYQKEIMLPIKYPLYSIALSMHDRFLCEFFEDTYSKYVDEEMNKITTPVNKEIAYLSDFEEYPNTDRIMKNKIHKYCHQIGQQINGGFTISPEDQNNIAELRRGLAWYWVATKQHYLLLHFVRASIDVDLKYSPAIELTPLVTDDLAILDDISKRRMAKEISVLLSTNLDPNHPIVISVIRHAQSSIQRFQQTMTPEHRSIYQEYEQMLQAAEHTDQRMFFALSLSVIVQTKEIIKNHKLKKEKKAIFLKKEKELKRQEIEYLVESGVNIDNLLNFNRDILESHSVNQQIPINIDKQLPTTTELPEITTSSTTTATTSTTTTASNNNNNSNDIDRNNIYYNLEISEEQKITHKLLYLERLLYVLKQEIKILSEHVKKQEQLSEAAVDIIVWTSLRLSLNINNNQDLHTYRDIVVKSLKEEESRMESEIKKLSLNSHRKTASNSSFSFLYTNQSASNKQGHHPLSLSELSVININDSDADAASSSSGNSCSSANRSSPIQMSEISVDVSGEDAPLWTSKRNHIISRPVIISATIVSGSAIVLIIIFVSIFLSLRS